MNYTIKKDTDVVTSRFHINQIEYTKKDKVKTQPKTT